MGSSLSSYTISFNGLFNDYNDGINYYSNVIFKETPCCDPSLNNVSNNNRNGNRNLNGNVNGNVNNNYFKFYKLYIYIDESVDNNIKQLYQNKAIENNMLVDSYLEAYNNIDASHFCYDAGFDLFCPESLSVYGESFMLDHKIKCCMKVYSQNNVIEHNVGYYLYCRSSTGSKTPLRLANSVGIIDSGYRGNIKACFDYNYSTKFENGFKLEAGDRYTQICPPNLEYPMKVYIVKNIDDLGNNTLRQSGGFGSTGK